MRGTPISFQNKICNSLKTVRKNAGRGAENTAYKYENHRVTTNVNGVIIYCYRIIRRNVIKVLALWCAKSL